MSDGTKSKKKWFFIPVIIVAAIVVVIALEDGGSSSSPSAVSTAESKAKTMTIEELKNKCSVVSYDDLKRNPDSHLGEFVCVQVHVEQKVNDKQWRVYTYDDDPWNFVGFNGDEEFFVFDKRTSINPNVIENDVITIYGIYGGNVSVKRAMSNTTDKVPSIEIYGLELLKK